MDKRDKGYTLYKKGLSCTEISKKLDVSINTVKSWRKRYWTQGADAPAKRTLHPEDAPAAPDPETRPKQGAPPGNVNAVGAGAPKGNRNAVKHGGWSELMFRSWTEEHRQLLDACDEDVDAEELLINELKLLTAREGYLLERISHYSKEGAYVQTQTTSKRSRNFKRLDGDTEKEKNDLQAYVEAIDGVKADKTEFVSFSIPATGWKTDSSVPGYTNYIDIAISGLTAADYVAVDVAPSSSAVARAANFVATESRAGILRLRAASVPTATISAQYHIITAATAAKEG